VNIHHARVGGDIIIHNGPHKEPKPTQPFEPETVPIPAGGFLMGHAPGVGIPDHETPEHRLTLPDYRIGRYPVTNAEYAGFIRHNSGREVPDHWQLRQPPPGRLDHPVSGVSWDDARAYCDWLSEHTGRRYRLPSEAQWEKAARGRSGRTYPWGGQWQDEYCNVATGHSSPVSTYPQGASEYGCEDLLGNVQEWTLSRWGGNPATSDYTYPYEPDDGRELLDTGTGRGYRIHRGGSWNSRPAQLRGSARGYSASGSRVAWRGFRVVQIPD